jgi:hypothetical protein
VNPVSVVLLAHRNTGNKRRLVKVGVEFARTVLLGLTQKAALFSRHFSGGIHLSVGDSNTRAKKMANLRPVK